MHILNHDTAKASRTPNLDELKATYSVVRQRIKDALDDVQTHHWPEASRNLSAARAHFPSEELVALARREAPKRTWFYYARRIKGTKADFNELVRRASPLPTASRKEPLKV